jgi:DNA replication protein DnaC
MTTAPATPTGSQPTEPLVDPLGGDLVALLRTLKLSGMKDTLPQRLTLAKARQLSHYQFLEQVLADEVARREDRSAASRAIRAGLVPRMRIETWTEPTDLHYDRQTLSDLTTLRFTDAGHNLLILGPVVINGS